MAQQVKLVKTRLQNQLKDLFCMYVYKGVRSPGIGAIDSSELLCGCWLLLSPSPMEEQSVPLLTTGPSISPAP